MIGSWGTAPWSRGRRFDVGGGGWRGEGSGRSVMDDGHVNGQPRFFTVNSIFFCFFFIVFAAV